MIGPESERKLRIVALPYRDLWYREKYGSTVRDLAMLKVLAKHPAVSEVIAICRPRVLYEPFDFARAGQRRVTRDGVLWEVSRSFDAIGPLGGRRWTEAAFGRQLGRWVGPVGQSRADLLQVFLDWHPIANVDAFLGDSRGNVFYWYDVIDNFLKHNRYSAGEVALVKRKYESVCQRARLVTGVTRRAVDAVGKGNAMVIPNSQFADSLRPNVDFTGEFDFGFLGFVTDKLDIEFVRQVASNGKRMIIAGEVLDSGVSEELKKLNGVTMVGKFHQSQADALMSRFAIGVIPYRESRSHDGSPLKAYQYLASGRAVISSLPFEVEGEWVAVGRSFLGSGIQSLVTRASGLIQQSFAEYARSVTASYPPGAVWESRVDAVISRVLSLPHED